MTQHLTGEAMRMLGAVRNPIRTANQRPALRLTWALDQKTGKPVGNWIACVAVPCPVRDQTSGTRLG
jgi:hypothetical protein